MGLDIVELVIRFEDTFAISIPDKVATEITTPRKVTDYIFSQVNVSSQGSCLSQQAFYFLRKQFVGVLGVPRAEFRPENQLESLLPLERRRENWLKMMDELGSSSLPTLARPVWLFSSLVLLSVLCFVIANGYARNHDAGAPSSFVFGMFVAMAVGYGGAIATRPLQRNFRKGHERVGDLAKFLIMHNPRCFKREWTRDQVAETVREIIIDETGVRDFSEDSHFIEDMHLD
jgi:acyl carrier protein